MMELGTVGKGQRKMKIGKRLAWCRTRSNHTQESLSAATGISRKHISAIETGASDVSLRALEALVRACGFTMEEFFRTGAKSGNSSPEHEEIHHQLEVALTEGGEDVRRTLKTMLDSFYSQVINAKKSAM